MARRTLSLYCAVMEEDNVLDDREAQTGAAQFF